MCWTKQNCLLLVGKVKSVRLGRPPPFLVPKGGLVRMSVARGRVVPFLLLGLGEAVEVAVLAQVVIGGDEEAAGAGGGILDHVIQRGLHDGDHAVDELARGEVLAGAGLLFVGVFFQQALVEIAEPFLPRGIPVELADVADEGGEGGGFLDEGGGVGEDLLHQSGAVRAEVDEGDLVKLEAIGRAFRQQIRPTVFLRDLVLGAGLLGHLEEEDVGEFGDVLVVGHAVVLEDVAEVPELGDDVVGHVGRSSVEGSRRAAFSNVTRV